MVRYLVQVVDGDPVILRFLRTQLEAEGYLVSVSTSGEEAAQRVEEERPDLVVLDSTLPDTDGLTVLRRIRERTHVPVIVLTAVDSCRQKVTALDLGADDYITKPFNTEEFLARVRAVLRRCACSPRLTADNVVDLGGLTIDLDGRRLLVGGREVYLSRTEWRLLYQLATNLDRVMLHRELLSKVWGTQFADDVQYLRVWVCRLRHKLGDYPDGPGHLVTIPGVGYRLQRGSCPPVPEPSAQYA